MSLGNFFSKLTKKTAEKKDNFLALEINSETVKAAVWSIANNQVEVLRFGSIEEWEDKEDLLKATDATVTSACGGISPEPAKIIFGLPMGWVEDGDGILQKKKGLLANLCEKLNLKPVGFVVSLEALITYLKMQQGTPPSAVFIQLSETEINVSLVNLGKVVDSQKVGRSEDLALDIKEGLARFKDVESLPARMILFDGLSDFEEAKQQIISFDWMAELPFLHFPRVDSLERDFVMKAIAIAGGTEVAKSLGFQIHEKESEKSSEEVTAQDLGFVEEKDIKEATSKIKINVKEEKEEVEKIGEKEVKEEEKIDTIKKPMINLFIKVFKLFGRLPRFVGKKLFLWLLPLILVIGLPIFAYFNFLKAQVTLYFAPQNVEEKITFTLDPKASVVDLDKAVIPAEELKTQVEGEAEADSTGEKLTGEKAKGEVTIYNKTDAGKTFSAGTVLVGEANLKFVLDEEATVASSSSQIQSDETTVTTPGKAKVKISAASVGEESNLKVGSYFSFKDYSSSSFSAKTEEGLSGGSSKKVKTVTAQDKKQLLDKLTKELEEKGKESLKNNLPEDKIILDKILTTTATQKKYDKEAGDEAEKLKLKMKLSVTTLAYNKNDMKKIIFQELKDILPKDFTLKDENLETEIINTEVKDNKIRVELNTKAILVPGLDTEKLKKELAGKSEAKAKDYLLSLPNLKRAKIDISPSFFGSLKTLPQLNKNIKIEIQVE